MSKITLVSVPIGNLGDFTTRSLQAIKDAKWILAEDTRNLKKLCELTEISTNGKKIEAFHDHSQDKVEGIIRRIKAGEQLVFCSDAGSPIISDPAYPLLKSCADNEIEIDTMPGVSACLTALELSALPPHPFTFHGFLSREKARKVQTFNDCQSIKQTHIFFESPHRIKSTLELLKNFDFQVVVARELTKKFQNITRFHSSEYEEGMVTDKEELVLLIYPEIEVTKQVIASDLTKLAQEILDKKAHPKSVSKLVSKILDMNTKDVYSAISSKR